MTDKRFRDLDSTASVNRQDILAIEQAGNSRRISAITLRNFTDLGAIATHLADATPHDITAYMMTLLANASLADLLADLGFAEAGDSSSGKYTLPLGYTFTWRSHTLGANTSLAKDYGSDHEYTTFGKAWVDGDDSDGEDVSIWVTSSATDSATVRNDGNASASFTLFSIGK